MASSSSPFSATACGGADAQPQIFNNLSGIGIQNTGELHVQGNVTIGTVGGSPDKDVDALRALRVTEPAADKARIQREKGQLLRECYEWVLSTDEFRQWYTENGQHVLWIKGDAGQGKTMLLCGIIDHLEQLPEPETKCVAYFFCQATYASLNNAINTLRGLLYSILAENKHLVAHLTRRLRHSGQNFFEDINAWDSLSSLLFDVLMDPRLPSHTYLIVDGLDECSTGLSELLNLFQKISSQTRVKLLLSSRKWPEISEGLARINKLELLSLELKKTHVSRAVTSFIQFKVAQLSEKKNYKPELRRTVHQHLIENSNATFLWVSLVCQELDDNKLRNVMVPKRLGKFPAGLQQFYNRMMEDILASDYTEYCRQILEAVAVTYRPLSMAELACLVENPQDFEEEGWLDEVIELCRSLIIRHEDSSVSFVHQSAKDFLINNQTSHGYPSITPKQHAVIVERSFRTMDQILRRNMYRLPHPGASVTSEPSFEDPLVSCRYSCLFWVEHLLEILKAQDPTYSRNLMDDNGLVHDFLMGHFPHWLESLSLLKSIVPGVSALARLDRSTEQLQERFSIQKSASCISTATRFAHFYKGVLEVAPLQVYMSAYAFIPRNARQMLFGNEVPQQPSWISHVRGSLEEGWSPRKMDIMPLTENPNWRGCCTRCLSISADGNWIAAMLTYDDPRDDEKSLSTIGVWDAKTGHCEGKVDHEYRGVDVMTFSSNGEYLAAAHDLSGIKVWRVATAECVGVMDHPGPGESECMALAFYEQAEKFKLVSFSTRGDVAHWDWTAKQCKRIRLLGREKPPIPQDFRDLFLIPEGFYIECGDVTKVAILDQGRKLAILDLYVELNRLTLGVWSSTTGECHCTMDLPLFQLQAGDLYDYTIAATSLGQRIAVGFHDTILVFDVATSHDPLLLQTHEDRITSLIFNESGSRLVAVKEGGEVIQLWNVDSLTCELTVSGTGASISSVEPTTMVTCTDGPTCFILWDISASVTGRALGTVLDVHGMALSGDLARAVSISSKGKLNPPKGEVRVWETDSGRCLERFALEDALTDLDPHSMKRLQFSRDLKLVAMITLDSQTDDGYVSYLYYRIVIFDIQERRLRCIIPLEKTSTMWGWIRTKMLDPAPAVAFSSCGDVMVTVAHAAGLGYKLSVWTTCSNSGLSLSDWTIKDSERQSGLSTLALVCSPQNTWAGAFKFGPQSQITLHTSVHSRYIGELHHDSACAAAFTSDWLGLATGCHFGTVKLWDTVTGQCTRSVDLKKGYLRNGWERHLSFSSLGGKAVTPWGLTDLRSLARSSGAGEGHDALSVLKGYGISEDGDWITRDGVRFLWIPPADRPSSDASFVLEDSVVAIYSRSGELYFCHLPDWRQEMDIGN